MKGKLWFASFSTKDKFAFTSKSHEWLCHSTCCDKEALSISKLAIRHLHISHNTPFRPPQFCISIVFYFSWAYCNTQEKSKTMLCKVLGGKQGVLWEMCKWRISGYCYSVSVHSSVRNFQYNFFFQINDSFVGGCRTTR